MTIPNDIPLFEHPIGTLWFDGDGILCMVSKPLKRDIEVMKGYIGFIKKLPIIKECVCCVMVPDQPQWKKRREIIQAPNCKIFIKL